MQIVDPGPSQFTPRDPVHRRPVACAPGVGELARVDRKSLGVGERPHLAHDAGAEIDAAAEYVEQESFHSPHPARGRRSSAYPQRGQVRPGSGQ